MKMVAMKKMTIALLGVTLLLLFSSAIALRYYYTQCMPVVPMVQQGRVVPIEVFYSKTVYVTSGEKRNLDILYCSVGAALVVYVLSYARLSKKGSHDAA
jgi:hypothetical protein